MFVISAAKLRSFFHKSKSETIQNLSETIQFLKLFRIQGNDCLVLLLLAGSLLRLFNKNLPEAISNGPLGYLGNSKTQLFGAYQVLEYILGQVSQYCYQSVTIIGANSLFSAAIIHVTSSSSRTSFRLV